MSKNRIKHVFVKQDLVDYSSTVGSAGRNLSSTTIHVYRLGHICRQNGISGRKEILYLHEDALLRYKV